MGHLNIQPVKQCFGHLFAIYIYHKAVYFIRQVFKSFKISYEHFIRNVTSKTFKLARVEGDMHNYVMSCQGAL
ncbi:hypothetical protein ABI_22380 [Asticcacaulis biprosthecium C19]|uniref:Uncharacterized protein n=2 Tax=Asticcacaulis biprosthecium TaxID=76891 RepID=F4QNB9_9CAUL|nr:hypothetical protein ABI_22380 [Asticcacaulis biprosthecium C19]